MKEREALKYQHMGIKVTSCLNFKDSHDWGILLISSFYNLKISKVRSAKIRNKFTPDNSGKIVTLLLKSPTDKTNNKRSVA